jgi:hypothetical protein
LEILSLKLVSNNDLPKSLEVVAEVKQMEREAQRR